MLHDVKHIKRLKIPVFASNIIRALKIAYNIKDKSDLFIGSKPAEERQRNYHQLPGIAHANRASFHNDSPSNIQDKMQHIAGYDSGHTDSGEMRDLMIKLCRVLEKRVER